MKLSLKMCLYVTAVGIVSYWVAIFSGVFSLDELVPGYRNWYLSFPLADLWIAAMSILAIVLAVSNRPMSAIAWRRPAPA